MLNTFFVVGDHFETRMYRIATKKKLSITISVLFAQHMLWGMLWPKATAEATALGFGTRVDAGREAARVASGRAEGGVVGD